MRMVAENYEHTHNSSVSTTLVSAGVNVDVLDQSELIFLLLQEIHKLLIC